MLRQPKRHHTVIMGIYWKGLFQSQEKTLLWWMRCQQGGATLNVLFLKQQCVWECVWVYPILVIEDISRCFLQLISSLCSNLGHFYFTVIVGTIVFWQSRDKTTAHTHKFIKSTWWTYITVCAAYKQPSWVYICSISFVADPVCLHRKGNLMLSPPDVNRHY